MSETMNASSKLSWLLDKFVADVAGVQHSVVLSNDGLLLAKSEELDADAADTLAAASSSLRSIGKSLSKTFERGAVAQTHVEMEGGYLFVCAAGSGACLTVLSERNADVASIGYEMGRLVKQVGDFLTAAPRDLLSEAPVERT